MTLENLPEAREENGGRDEQTSHTLGDPTGSVDPYVSHSFIFMFSMSGL